MLTGTLDERVLLSQHTKSKLTTIDILPSYVTANIVPPGNATTASLVLFSVKRSGSFIQYTSSGLNN